jgi:hypothetical protein
MQDCSIFFVLYYAERPAERYGFENLTFDGSIRIQGEVDVTVPGSFELRFTCTIVIANASEALALNLVYVEATSPTHSRLVQELVVPVSADSLT